MLGSRDGQELRKQASLLQIMRWTQQQPVGDEILNDKKLKWRKYQH